MIKDSNELDKTVMEYVHNFDVSPILQHMGLVAAGQILEVKNENDRPNLYYQWLACLMKVVKPQQAVELGAAAGISTIMMATSMPKDSKLYSVDNDPEIAWKWMDREYPQVIKIMGDTRDMGIWNSWTDVDLKETDVWFFDSLHTEEQLRKELEVYTPFFKKGAILVFDDIHINEGMNKVWDELPYDKHDNSTPLHYSGFGICIV